MKPAVRIFILLSLLSPAVIPGTSVLAAEERVQTKTYNLEPLRRDLQTGMDYRRVIAVQMLGRIRTPEAVAMLIDAMLRDKSAAVRRAAQRELVRVDDERIFPAIRDAVSAPERRVRLAAVEALGLVRGTPAAELLLQTIRAAPRDEEQILLALEAMRTLAYHVEPAPGFERSLAFLLEHKNKKIRLTTAAILGIWARPDSLDPLLALWPKADDRLKTVLADAFANIGRAAPVPALTEALRSRNTDVTVHALYALSQIQSFSALEPIRRLLASTRNARVRMAGLNALLEIPDPDNVPTVLTLIDNEDPAVRHWAAYALGELDAREAIPALMKRLQDPASLVRATAVTALAELRAPDLEPRCLELVNDRAQENDVRVAAARALMTLGSRAGAQVFWDEMRRRELDLGSRLTFALALGANRDPVFARKLEANLGDDDFLTAFSSALALGTMGNGQGRTLLAHSLDHGEPLIRRYAILGLERIHTSESLRALADTANDDPDPLVRVLCASSLAAAGFPEYRVKIWNALDDKNEDLRQEAVIALGRNADAEILRQLKWYLRREPSVPVRETILRLLRRKNDSISPL